MKGPLFPQPVSREPVEISDYDPGWRRLFEKERLLLASTLGGIAKDIQHVGSTAVPGLPAKPIIDIMIGVRDLDLSQDMLAAMETIGYEFRGDGGVPGRLYFRKGNPRSHQIHMTILGSDFWEEHVLFRDLLRTHDVEARQYGALKQDLAKRHRNDRYEYNEAKTEFINGALRRAQMEANLDHWDEVTPFNAASDFYDLDGFRSGDLSLHCIEMDEVGDVYGKTLFHLQCHFGMDSLSWAKLGAKVTAVDFSPEGVQLARSLSEETNIPAQFIQSNIYDLPQVLDGEFDIVFTSYGVLVWLPDLESWAKVAARYVKPGGVFYIADFHPFAYVFDDREDATELRVHYPYFHSPQPLKFEPQGSYADRETRVTKPTYEWNHSLGDVVNSLIQAGLRIEYVHEHECSVYQMLPFLEKGSDGMWRLPPGSGEIPLMFSIRAYKPER